MILRVALRAECGIAWGGWREACGVWREACGMWHVACGVSRYMQTSQTIALRLALHVAWRVTLGMAYGVCRLVGNIT